jgi:glycosyltransferase involved in cell wall biosynthesis
MVSVVLPTHNRPALLAEALQSIAAQTIGDWEVIVVDDASDPPAQLLATEDKRLHVVRLKASRGGAGAKNTGASLARGDVLAFLDDDDLYAPTYLARALAVLDRHPEVQVVFMGVSWFGSAAAWGEQAYRGSMQRTLAEAQGQEIEPAVLRFDDRLVPALLDRVPMAFQRPVVRRSAFERIGGYREGCLLWDCDWAIRAALEVPVALIQDGLYLQRAERQGYSSRPDRRLEHVLSAIEIRETLLKSAATDASQRRWQSLLHQSAAQSWFDLAYQQQEAGRSMASLAAWWHSQKHSFQPARAKFLLRVFLGLLRPPRVAGTVNR